MSIFTLSKDEKIIATIRKHWFILLRDIFGLIVIYIIPFVAYWYFFDNIITPKILIDKIYTNFTPSIMVFAVSSWTLVIWVKLFAVWTDYYLDVWFITDKRIIDVEQKGFFKREVSTFRMERIQDITIDTKGIIATFLDFGDIHAQTAGESREFIIKGISRPKQTKEIIMKQSDKVIK